MINSNNSFQGSGKRASFLLLAFVFRYPHDPSVFSGLRDALGVCGHLSCVGHSQNGVIVNFSQFYSRFWRPFPPPFGKLSVNPVLYSVKTHNERSVFSFRLLGIKNCTCISLCPPPKRLWGNSDNFPDWNLQPPFLSCKGKRLWFIGEKTQLNPTNPSCIN